MIKKITKKEYRTKLINCIVHQDHRNKARPDKFYYEDSYATKIREYFDNQSPKVKSLETIYSSRSKTTSICSFLSSGRLCYNYFRNLVETGEKKAISFEVPLENDLPYASKHPTKMDAVDYKEKEYYECKCDEITASKHDLLSISYFQKSTLFNEFGITRVTAEKYINESSTDEQQKESVYIKFPASLLVDFTPLLKEFPKYKNCCYNEMCFDFKQFVCHLLALARVEGKKKLIYVVFVPNKKELDYYPALMQREMECIKNSPKIDGFMKEHGIDFGWNFVSIGDVVDINYQETYKNK